MGSRERQKGEFFSEIKTKTFKNALCNWKNNTKAHLTQDKQKGEKILEIDPPNTIIKESNGIPIIIFLDRIKNYQKQALIIKTTGRTFDVTYLKMQPFSLWRLKAEPEILHSGFNFYVVHNLLAEDRIKILTSPWRLGKDPILV